MPVLPDIFQKFEAALSAQPKANILALLKPQVNNKNCAKPRRDIIVPRQQGIHFNLAGNRYRSGINFNPSLKNQALCEIMISFPGSTKLGQRCHAMIICAKSRVLC